jgi:orotate phosphoribosyltransferase
MKGTFIDLLSINRGHFALESGLHGDIWFDLENVFVRPPFVEPFADGLAKLLSPYDLSALCGALVGGAFVAYSIALRLGIDFFYTERSVYKASTGSERVDYRIPKPLRSAVANRRIGIVDDVINAGSAVIKTCEDLRSLGGNPIVMASILTVGGSSPKQLSSELPPVVSLEHLESNLWDPEQCPLCRSGIPLVKPYDTKMNG